ncbi:MAG: hypothetical protein KGR24_06280 [Planctomycetes bacterium]|nr:hypothetical protein [Planctomycetota bacterium]
MFTVHHIDAREAWLRDSAGRSCCWLVKHNGQEIGLLEKRRGEPWKAFRGIGRESSYVGPAPSRDAAIELVAQAVRQ